MIIEDVPAPTTASTTHAGLVKDAREGDRLLADNGKVALLARKTLILLGHRNCRYASLRLAP